MPQIIPRQIPMGTFNVLVDSGLSPLFAKIFAARQVHSPQELDTSLNRLLPFDLLKGIDQMAKNLADLIDTNKRILIVADYDADGATACAVCMRGLRSMGARVDFIVPNRFEYGYGLTPEIVRLAAESKPDALLTVDNGISSVDGVAEAKRLGMTVLITDHHLPGDNLPAADCVVNPNQSGCSFPSKNLAGVGVAFYVLLALRAELRNRGTFSHKPEPNLANLLDVVALGTVADVVKLDMNNRILVHQGLQRIRAGRACAGINALLRIAKKHAENVSSYELGFAIGPRLNAAGRLEDMGLGIQCLLTDDPIEAQAIAAKLDTLNLERRSIEADMQQTALASLANIDPVESYTLTLFDTEWHQGVIGILASKIKEQFHRPVIAFSRSNHGELKGSGRSIHGFHLRDALDLLAKRHPHLLQKFGGHAMAAGLTIREEHFGQFQLAFEEIAQTLLRTADLVKIIETDGELAIDELTLENAISLGRQVWGQGFAEPLFEGRFSVQSQRIVGEKHTKLQLVMHKNAGPKPIEAIHFFSIIPLPSQIHAVYSLSVNEYMGNTQLQLILRHWEPV